MIDRLKKIGEDPILDAEIERRRRVESVLPYQPPGVDWHWGPDPKPDDRPHKGFLKDCLDPRCRVVVPNTIEERAYLCDEWGCNNRAVWAGEGKKCRSHGALGGAVTATLYNADSYTKEKYKCAACGEPARLELFHYDKEHRAIGSFVPVCSTRCAGLKTYLREVHYCVKGCPDHGEGKGYVAFSAGERTALGAEVAIGGKADAGKRPWHLVPWNALGQIVEVLDYGAKKYAPGNWRNVPDAKARYFSATMRHLTAWMDGQQLDPESGLHHLAHAGCCVLFMLALDERKVPR